MERRRHDVDHQVNLLIIGGLLAILMVLVGVGSYLAVTRIPEPAWIGQWGLLTLGALIAILRNSGSRAPQSTVSTDSVETVNVEAPAAEAVKAELDAHKEQG